MEIVSFAMVTVQRGLCTMSMVLLVVRRHRLADVLDELVAVAEECGRLPRALPKAPRTPKAVCTALLVRP